MLSGSHRNRSRNRGSEILRWEWRGRFREGSPARRSLRGGGGVRPWEARECGLSLGQRFLDTLGEHLGVATRFETDQAAEYLPVPAEDDRRRNRSHLEGSRQSVFEVRRSGPFGFLQEWRDERMIF